MINYSIKPSVKRRDSRGFLVDFLKKEDLTSNFLLGQVYYVTFENSGVVRGNHYHKNKNEWFVVVSGKVRLIIENIKTKERKTIVIDGDQDRYKRLFVGRNTAHAFQSISRFASMINYADKPYHNENPDTHVYKLI